MSVHPDQPHLYVAPVLRPLSPRRAEYLTDHAILVERGKISAVASAASFAGSPGLRRIVLEGQMIMPGLTDAHLHLAQLDAVALDGHELLDWLEHHIFPAESALSHEELARDTARRFFAELTEGGTTAAAIYTSLHENACHIAFEEAERSGLRAAMGKPLMDTGGPYSESTGEAISSMTRLFRRWHGAGEGRLQFAVTPRFALSCSDGLMAAAGRLARDNGLLVQTHMSENLDEIRAVRERFPQHSSYGAVYDHFGLMGPRTLLAHCIHLTEDEKRLLAEREATVAHCPRSNLFLRSGMMHVRSALQNGIRVGLGTDIAAGPTTFMPDEMRAAIDVSKARYALDKSANGSAAEPLTPEETLYMATAGGADALGLHGVRGRLLPGEEADFIAVDIQSLHPQGGPPGFRLPERPLLSRFIYRATPAMITGVWVRGRRLKGENPPTATH
ncbi:MAG: Guanine deaminase [Myxococcota bacterium]|nr:Guanine deaminase [Myxococcota bacterium]